MSDVQVRVSDVAAHALLADAQLLGVPIAPSGPVASIELVLPHTLLDADLPPHAGVVLALDATGETGYREHLIDVMLRRASTNGSSVVIVVGAQLPVADTTKLLAARFNLSLLLAAPTVSSTELVVALRELVATPKHSVSEVVRDVARRLNRTPKQLDHLAELLQSALPGANIYACTGRESVLTGTPQLTAPSEIVQHRTPGFVQREGSGAAIRPIEGLEGEISVWLVAERERAGRMWLESADAALNLCVGAVLAWIAREQTALERDARMRSALLTEVLESGQHISRDVAEQAAGAGWQLEGWHTGVHFHFKQMAPTALAVRTLAEELRGTDIRPSTFVERTDGWSAWLTTLSEPGPDHARRIARQIEAQLKPPPRGEGIVIGIGSPQRDVAGIATTLAEARQAATIAASSTRPVSIQVLQELGPSRLLLGWYSSAAFADYAHQTLEPLLDLDDAVLIRTFEAYLERSCSAAQTARSLGVHRNTVAQRVAKAERVLGTTVANADTRLAIQLALRVLRARPAE